MKVWAKALPSTAPGGPNIVSVTLLAGGLGALLALVGVVILVVTFLKREKALS